MLFLATFYEISGNVYPSCYNRMLKYVNVKLCRSIFFVMGFHWVKVKGKQATSSEAPVVCIAPHSSLFDAIALCVGTELSGVVSAVDHTRIPFIGSRYQVFIFGKSGATVCLFWLEKWWTKGLWNLCIYPSIGTKKIKL